MSKIELYDANGAPIGYMGKGEIMKLIEGHNDHDTRLEKLEGKVFPSSDEITEEQMGRVVDNEPKPAEPEGIDYVTKENGYCYNGIGNNGYHDGLHPKGMYCDTCENVPWELGNELIQARAENSQRVKAHNEIFDELQKAEADNAELKAKVERQRTQLHHATISETENVELNAERITKNDAILKYRNDIHRITADRAELKEQRSAVIDYAQSQRRRGMECDPHHITILCSPTTPPKENTDER